MLRPQDRVAGVHIAGYNADSDTGDDIWDGSAAYPFPAAAAATTIVSASADDTAAGDGGTGARTVLVEGLDANRRFLSEVVSLNGATPVTLAGQYLRINHVVVATAGSGGANAGIIHVKHAATVLAHLVAAANMSSMAIYTLPAGSRGYLLGWRATSAGNAILALQVRPPGGLWYTVDTLCLLAAGKSGQAFANEILPSFDGGSDFRVRAILGADSMSVAAGFELAIAGS